MEYKKKGFWGGLVTTKQEFPKSQVNRTYTNKLQDVLARRLPICMTRE